MTSNSSRNGATSEAPRSEFMISKSSGGALPFVKPIFTNGKKFLIVLTSLELRVYTFTTRQCIKSVALDGRNATDMFLDKEDKVWIACSDGKVLVVNVENKSVEQEFDLGRPILRIIDVVSDSRLVLVTGAYKSEAQLVDVVQSTEKEESDWEWNVILTAASYRDVAVSTTSKSIVFSSKSGSHEALTVGRVDSDYKLVQEAPVVKRTRPSASLAISDDGILAVGSQTGVVDVYYKLFEKNLKQAPYPRPLKWHVDSVKSLSFSLDNNYLISGGKERVLVFWQLDTNRSQLLPRLNGDILSITVDPSSELYALHLSNGELVVLSAVDLMSRLQIGGVNPDFTRLPVKRKKYKTVTDNYKVPDFTAPFYINPLTGYSYLPTGEAANIQVYDTVQDEQKGTFAAATAIQMGKVKGETHIEDPKIKHVCFSKDGKWMATIDEYLPPSIDGLLSENDKQINLKFWKYSQTNGEWVLTTRVSSPHGINKSVLDVVAADPSYHKGHAFLTCCENGGLRLWRPETLKEIQSARDAKVNQQGRQISWSVRRVLPPLGSKSSAASVTWSSDNSTIILGFESTLYVIDAEKFEVQHVLPNILSSRVRWMQIVGNHLVVLAKTRLVVYDLVNSTCKWSVRVISSQNGGRLIDVDPLSGTIALAVNCVTVPDYSHESRIFVFSTDSPIPIYSTTHKYAISSIRHVPGSLSPKFVFLDVNARFVTLETTDSDGSKKAVPSDLVDGFEASIGALYASKQHQPVVKAVDFDAVSKKVSAADFDKVFDEGDMGVAGMEALFSRVMGVLAGPSSVQV